MCERDSSLSRRELLAGAAVTAAGAAVAPAAVARASVATAARPAGAAPLGSGGAPTGLPALARLARDAGRGEPLVFCDLAAVDRNADVLLRWARAHRFAVRPALKAFQSAGLCGYVLRRLPRPRGMVFHLNTVDEVLAEAPAGTDLMMGYPPTLGQLERYLATAAPPGQPSHRLRLLVDSPELLEHVARLARSTPRALPLDVAIEFDSGMGRGGVHQRHVLAAMLRTLRRERSRLRLGAVLCYDGHATLDGARAWRLLVARTAEERFRKLLVALEDEGGDLYDARTLIRNGPASSNYRNWTPGGPANEMSPGSAFVFAGYLQSFDHGGLTPAITQASPLMRITSDHPSVPYTQTTVPGSTREEVVIEAGPWAGSEMVHPPGMSQDELSGGGFALVAPKGALRRGDYVLMRPQQSGDGIEVFGSLLAVRGGRLLRRWPTVGRWSS